MTWGGRDHVLVTEWDWGDQSAVPAVSGQAVQMLGPAAQELWAERVQKHSDSKLTMVDLLKTETTG